MIRVEIINIKQFRFYLHYNLHTTLLLMVIWTVARHILFTMALVVLALLCARILHNYLLKQQNRHKISSYAFYFSFKIAQIANLRYLGVL
jgi:hypothetical protein